MSNCGVIPPACHMGLKKSPSLFVSDWRIVRMSNAATYNIMPTTSGIWGWQQMNCLWWCLLSGSWFHTPSPNCCIGGGQKIFPFSYGGRVLTKPGWLQQKLAGHPSGFVQPTGKENRAIYWVKDRLYKKSYSSLNKIPCSIRSMFIELRSYLTQGTNSLGRHAQNSTQWSS